MEVFPRTGLGFPPEVLNGGVLKLITPTFVLLPLTTPNSEPLEASGVKSAPGATPLLFVGVIHPSMENGPALAGAGEVQAGGPCAETAAAKPNVRAKAMGIVVLITFRIGKPPVVGFLK